MKRFLIEAITAILFCCTMSGFTTVYAEDSTQGITVLSNTEEENVEIVEVRELSFREKLISKLEEAHRKGELLDISIQDIRNLPMAQLKAIESAEDFIEEGNRMLQEYFQEPQENNVYLNEKPHEQRVFENIIEKIRENKGILGGMVAFSALSSFAYVRYGRKITMEETDEEYNEREKRLEKASKARIYRHPDRIETYTDYLSPQITGEDVIKTLASQAIFTPSETQYKETIRLACTMANVFTDTAKEDIKEELQNVKERLDNGEQIPKQDLKKFYEVSRQILNERMKYRCAEPSLQKIKETEWERFEEVNKNIKNILTERKYRNIP